MFDTDAEIRNHALNMWANYIETSNPLLSAKDAEQQNASFPAPSSRLSFQNAHKSIRINALDESQMALVLRIRKLAKDELTEKPKSLKP